MLKKVATFIVYKRMVVIVLFTALALAGAVLMNFVATNYDMTSYLPKDSKARQGIAVMTEEFGENSVIRLMFKGLSDADKEKIIEELPKIKYVDDVQYEAGSEEYDKDGNTLFVINVGADSYSSEAAEALEEIEEKYADGYDAYTSGVTKDNQLLGLNPKMLALAIVVLIIILLVMSSSWLEPVLILCSIGIAVLLNEGTNIILPNVSSMTRSIAAILQLALSMDYSIMLIDRYRQEREKTPDKEMAMRDAVSGGFLAIAGSSATTVVGLLCLIFMSFTIGMDMGLVLAKGVFFSLIAILFVLPALLLFFDKAVEKTRKKTLRLKMGGMARFEHKCRYIIMPVFLVLFIGGFLLKDRVLINFSMSSQDPDRAVIEEVFPESNTLVILYPNGDEDKTGDVISFLDGRDGVTGVTGFSNTLGRQYTAAELAKEMNMEKNMLNIIYYKYFDGKIGSISLRDFMAFAVNDLAQNEQFNEYFTADMLAQLSQMSFLTDKTKLTQPLGAEELTQLLNMDKTLTEQLFFLYIMQHGGANMDNGKISLQTMVNFIVNEVSQSAEYAGFFDQETLAQLQMVQMITESVLADKTYTAAELAGILGAQFGQMDADMLELMYMYYFSTQNAAASWKISFYDFIDYMTGQIMTDSMFSGYFDEETAAQMAGAKEGLETGKKSLVGENYSRLIINTTLGKESEEMYDLIDQLENEFSGAFSSMHFLGDSPVAYEMTHSFARELNFITLLTVITVFLVVAVAFRSIAVPAILVMLIQCAVYMTTATAYIQGKGTYYLAMIIVQAILMGATIDYAILYTEYYKRLRQTENIKTALTKAYQGSIMTVLTSSSILFFVTLIVGLLSSDTTTSEVCLTISAGSFFAVFLVIFVLPALLTVFDRLVCGKKRI